VPRPPLLAILAVAAALAGCYTPHYEACQVRCGADGACPSGQSCGEDGFCHGGGGDACLPVFARVTVGGQHSCGVQPDGTLWCWGANDSGQLGNGTAKPSGSPSQVGVDVDWQQAAAGNDFTCGLRLDGSLWCWGDLTGQKAFSPALADPGPWGRLVVSGERRCVISAGNQLWCADRLDQDLRQVGVDADWVTVGIGGQFYCGLRAPGSLWCWGQGSHGSLADGDGSEHSVAAPQRAGVRADYTDISCGTSFCCAVTQTGELFCWGNGYLTGTLGNPMPPTSVAVPTQVGTGTDWRAVAAGPAVACGVHVDGTLACWGVGLVGDGTTASRETPSVVAPGSHWQSVALGGGHACGLRVDGTVWCWGDNDGGQLGNGSVGAKTAPVPIGEETSWQSVAIGGYHTCALRADGSLACFGLDSSGQLGLGTDQASLYPAEVESQPPWRAVAAGDFHTCAVRTDGSTWCWGKNDQGAVGDRTNLNQERPTEIAPATDWESLALGPDVSCGLRGDHAIWCWGDGDMTGPQKLAGEWLALSQLDGSACGLDADGAIYCDSVPNDQLEHYLAEDATWTTIAGNASRGCALDAAGALTCWGANDVGQLGIGTTGSSEPPTPIAPGRTWTRIVVGTPYTCGIQSDHTLWCWGRLDVPTTDGVVPRPAIPTQVEDAADWREIAVSNLTSMTWSLPPPTLCGIREPGTLWCWGSNRFGQLGDGTGGSLVPIPVVY
jgi:alpha-tubulin suppressor-like RCC1 family protein